MILASIFLASVTPDAVSFRAMFDPLHILGIIYVFNRKINSEFLCCQLEFFSGISKRLVKVMSSRVESTRTHHERQDTKQKKNGICSSF